MNESYERIEPLKQSSRYEDWTEDNHKIKMSSLIPLKGSEDYTGSAFPNQKGNWNTTSDPNPPSDNEMFKLIFIGTICFTALMIILGFILIILELNTSKTNNLKSYINGFFDLGKIGFGAIVGLLGSSLPKILK